MSAGGHDPYAMSESTSELTKLQFLILDGMADDVEDVEQLYLHANRRYEEEARLGIEFPLVVRVTYPLRDVIDELVRMLKQGYIEVKGSSKETLFPAQHPEFGGFHHYWFGPTKKGKQAWRATAADS